MGEKWVSAAKRGSSCEMRGRCGRSRVSAALIPRLAERAGSAPACVTRQTYEGRSSHFWNINNTHIHNQTAPTTLQPWLLHVFLSYGQCCSDPAKQARQPEEALVRRSAGGHSIQPVSGDSTSKSHNAMAQPTNHRPILVVVRAWARQPKRPSKSRPNCQRLARSCSEMARRHRMGRRGKASPSRPRRSKASPPQSMVALPGL